MKSARETIAEMRNVLEAERRSIRVLDGKGVERAAAAKEALATLVGALPSSELVALRPELSALRAELRRNGILLAHARACLREVRELEAAHVAEAL